MPILQLINCLGSHIKQVVRNMYYIIHMQVWSGVGHVSVEDEVELV